MNNIFCLGSSNGTFVNNIRLSKSGEESKMTEVFTNDILRFGSDIVDKSRQVYNSLLLIRFHNSKLLQIVFTLF